MSRARDREEVNTGLRGLLVGERAAHAARARRARARIAQVHAGPRLLLHLPLLLQRRRARLGRVKRGAHADRGGTECERGRSRERGRLGYRAPREPRPVAAARPARVRARVSVRACTLTTGARGDKLRKDRCFCGCCCCSGRHRRKLHRAVEAGERGVHAVASSERGCGRGARAHSRRRAPTRTASHATVRGLRTNDARRGDARSRRCERR